MKRILFALLFAIIAPALALAQSSVQASRVNINGVSLGSTFVGVGQSSTNVNEILNAITTGYNVEITFRSVGTAKWQFGKDASDNFFIYDNVNALDAVTVGTGASGQVTLGEAGQITLPKTGGATLSGNINLTGVLDLPISTWADNKTCTAGQISVDASYIYVCTSTNVVKRAALSTF